MASKGRPYRTVLVDGYEILVGRNASDNDYLTFRVAKGADAWLHVAGGIPGSHVVVRNASAGEVPREVLERAAQFAAWYSKARGAPRVEVHCCKASDVSKERGAPAGQVRIKKFRRISAVPAPIEPGATDDAEVGD